MPPSLHDRAGFSLLELVIVLLVVATLSGLAVPAIDGAITSIRARAALDQLTAELYRARMLAVRNGRPVHFLLEDDADGCTRRARLETGPGLAPVTLPPLDLRDLCLRHTGDTLLVFDARGMLRPPSRSFSLEHGRRTDRVILSIAGRIRRASR